MTSGIHIDADFPGGNINLGHMDGQTVHVRQDLRDTDGHWFYWCFRVRGAGGQTLRFEFNDTNVIGVHGPAISHNDERNWRWLGAGCADQTGFTHQFADDEQDVRLAMCMTYVASDLDHWLTRHENNRRLKIETLCRSPRGAAVPLLRINPVGAGQFGVLLTCRHHSCEAMASYTLEGLVDAMLGDDELGRWFGEYATVAVVPMVDYDGVQAGDQGKNRGPHDHNRDYSSSPIYPEVHAIQQLVQQWNGTKLAADLDLHCPWLRGMETNQVVYLVGSRDPAVWRQQQRFGTILEEVRRGPIIYEASDNLPFGQAWNTGGGSQGLVTHTQWMRAQMDGELSSSVEIPYADVKGRAISADDARLLGRDMAEALRRYLQDQ